MKLHNRILIRSSAGMPDVYQMDWASRVEEGAHRYLVVREVMSAHRPAPTRGYHQKGTYGPRVGGAS
jgi:hypothetical protein